jgi:predicted dehydrogenase
MGVNMSLGWGILGLGSLAKNHMGPAIGRAARTKLVAVCDLTMGQAEEFASRYGAKRAYDSIDKLLKDPEIDVLLVATPNSLHARHTIQAAEAGKHVLCEKPMALTVADGEGMIEACHKNKVMIGVDFQNRYHPAHTEARRLIRSGSAGEINVSEARYCRGASRGFSKGWRTDPSIAGAGALMGQSLHPIDLLRFLLDKDVVEVRALVDEDPPHHRVDDMNYIILTFDSGTHGVVISGTLAPRPDNDAVLYGTGAKITCKGTVGMQLQGELIVEGNAINTKMGFPVTETSGSDLYVRVVEDFNKCILEKSETEISGHNGLQMIRIANAVLESSRKGKAVRLK